VLSYELATAVGPRIAGKPLPGRGSEAMEIIENFHGLLHTFTFVAASADVNW
jgi:hypothetical protein